MGELRRAGFEEIRCPRCGKASDVPKADAANDPAAPGEPKEAVFRRRGDGWESFKCACDRTIQLSPAFEADRVSCKHCGRHIRIEG